MDARAITKALGGKWAGRYGLARCPAHSDREPSLKVSDDPRRGDGVDVCCFAGCEWRDVKAALVRQRLLPEFSPSRTPALPSFDELARDVADSDDEPSRIELALRVWNASGPLSDTLAWRYFTERRCLHIGLLDSLDHCLRFHLGFGAVVALMTDPITNKACGVHRTFLSADATKRDKRMLGSQGVVRLSPDKSVSYGLGLAEGVEDALAVLLSGWSPMWAATSAGAIKSFPVLPGIDALTLFRDDDSAGSDAADACAQRWHDAGREVFLASLKEQLQ